MRIRAIKNEVKLKTTHEDLHACMHACDLKIFKVHSNEGHAELAMRYWDIEFIFVSIPHSYNYYIIVLGDKETLSGFHKSSLFY